MDAMDILGGLLGRKSSRGGAGGQILKDILSGGRKKPQITAERPEPREEPRRAPEPRRQSFPPAGQSSSGRQSSQGGGSLDDLLAEAFGHHGSRRPSPQTQAPTRRRPQAQPHTHSRQAEVPQADYRSFPRREQKPEPHPMNAEAEILIRAMVMAAKSDGQINDAEQKAIVDQLGDLDENEVQFLRTEFARPVDARDFAWSVPVGLEEKVYAISLMAMDLDEQKEAQYLGELAHGLRLAPDRCNQIHDQYRAPRIFK